jgi:hypothetical protein
LIATLPACRGNFALIKTREAAEATDPYLLKNLVVAFLAVNAFLLWLTTSNAQS